jgi:hypothetical protein
MKMCCYGKYFRILLDFKYKFFIIETEYVQEQKSCNWNSNRILGFTSGGRHKTNNGHHKCNSHHDHNSFGIGDGSS